MTVLAANLAAMSVDEKQQIKKCFGSAALSYNSAARLQRVTGKYLFESNKSLFYGVNLDLGCGTGINSKRLCSLPDSVNVGCDLSLDMAYTASAATDGRLVSVQGDGCELPFVEHSFDAVYSNLMLQWIDALTQPLQELYRVLKPGGSLCFSTLLAGTLDELKCAWATIDNEPHVNRFKSLAELRSDLEQSGFIFDIEVAQVVLDYQGVTHLAKELKYLGASYVKSRKNKGLTGTDKWRRLSDNYPSNGQTVPATYVVAYVVAKKPLNHNGSVKG